MSQSTVDAVSETGDDSLSAITFDSDIETKTKRKGSYKPPSTSPKSPYYSKPRKGASWRSLKTVGSMPLSSRMSLTPQKLWLGASKQGHISGTSIYREKEDMYDEIIGLKKSLHMQKSDVDLMRTKLRRLEEENSRKDRQIEQLLDRGRGPDFVRTLAEKRPDTGWVITGLKQRIFRLEQQCRDKDNTINKLQTDMKTTNLEEMRIAVETYYEEIHRLQTLLASSEAMGKKPIMEKKMGVKRQKKMSSALLNLTRSVQELTEENQSLKEDLDRMLSNSPTVSKMKGYVDWSKPRLLRRIAELEKKVNSSESPKPSTSELVKSSPLPGSSSSSSVQKQPKGDQPKGDPPEDQEHLRTVMSLKAERSALQSQLLEKDLEMKQLLQAKIGLQKELEMARESEEERREREQALSLEIKQLLQAKIGLQKELELARERDEERRALREKIEALTNKCQELEEAKRQERDSSEAVTPEANPELHASSPCSRHSEPDSNNEPDSHSSASEGDGSQTPTPCSEERREAAIRTLQAQWKAHRHKKRKAALDEAATVLQAAFRGHLARSKLVHSKAPASRSPSLPGLPSSPHQLQSSPTSRVPSPVSLPEDSPALEEAITVIQSVLRGYLAQARFIASGCRGITASAQKEAALARPWTPASPTCLAASRGMDSQESSGETAKDEDEAEEPAALQPCSGATTVGLSAKEELREPSEAEPAPSSPPPSVPQETTSASAQGGHWDCPSPSSLEAVSLSSVKDVTCSGVCEERSSSTGSARLSLELSPQGLEPESPPPEEDNCSDDSDDSDDIIFSPFLPRKKSPSPF